MHRRLFFLLLLAMDIHAEAQSHRLHPGDSIPLSTMQYLKDACQDGHVSADLSKTKLFLLYFWHASCTGCVAAFADLESLQAQYGNGLRIVTINKEDKRRIDSVFWVFRNSSSVYRMPRLPHLIQDTLFSSLFSHKVDPMAVWIRADRRIQAITTAEYINKENMDSVMSRAAFNMPEEQEFQNFDAEKPYLSQLPLSSLSYYSCIYPAVPGLTGHNHRYFIDSVNETVRISLSYMSIGALYEDALFHVSESLDPWHNQLLSYGKQVKLQVRDPGQFCFEMSGFKIYSEWLLSNSFDYEQVLPLREFDHMYDHMLQSLNSYFNLDAKIIHRKMPCLALVRTSKVDKIKWKGVTYMTEENADTTRTRDIGQRLSTFISQLSSACKNKPWICTDHTGYHELVEISLESKLDDLPSLRRELRRKYDLDLVWTMETVPIMKLTQRNAQPIR